MNVWECEHPSCIRSCVGVGGAIGLRSIGWFFEKGDLSFGIVKEPKILCPLHHPEGIEKAREQARISQTEDPTKKSGV